MAADVDNDEWYAAFMDGHISDASVASDGDGKEVVKKDGWVEHQESLLLKLLASELQVEIEDIVDFELSLFDIQKASLGGVHSGECIKYIIFRCTVPNFKFFFFPFVF